MNSPQIAKTRAELSLLLYFEVRAVDYRGLVRDAQMNSLDFEIAKRWDKDGFVSFKRVPASAIAGDSGNRVSGHLVVLSDAAWLEAHAERRARSHRLMGTATSTNPAGGA
jgi:hypothetical protein